MPDFPHHHRRPPWARRLDRALGRVLGPLGALLGRPDDRLLTGLARVDRPAPPVSVPTPADLGVSDPLADGRAALDAGALGDALHHFGQLLAAHPDHPWGWHGRGDAFQLLGEPEQALAAYDRAAALQPKVGIHQGGRANALDALGRIDAAREAQRRALDLDPSLGWMWSGREG